MTCKVLSSVQSRVLTAWCEAVYRERKNEKKRELEPATTREAQTAIVEVRRGLIRSVVLECDGIMLCTILDSVLDSCVKLFVPAYLRTEEVLAGDHCLNRALHGL